MTPHSSYKRISWFDYKGELLAALLMAIAFIFSVCFNPEKVEIVSKTLVITKTKKKEEQTEELPYSTRVAKFFHKRDSTRKAEGKEPCPQFQTLSLAN